MQISCFFVNSLKQNQNPQVSLSKTAHVQTEQTHRVTTALLVLGYGRVWTCGLQPT